MSNKFYYGNQSPIMRNKKHSVRDKKKLQQF